MARFPTDPQTRQRVLLGMLLVAAVAYVGYDYLYVPRAAGIVELESRLERLETVNRAALARTQGGGIAAAEQQLDQYRAHLGAMEGLIPTSEELPDLLDAISAEARRSGVELTLLQPVNAEKQQFYTRRTYDLAVVGPYHGIGEFLTQVASLERIVTPTNLSLVPKPNERRPDQVHIEAAFAIETYVLPGPGDDASPMPTVTPRTRPRATRR